MKIFHFADIHYNEKDHAEIEKCIEFMIAKIEAECPDAIICSGDVTNSQYLNADTKSAKSIMDQFRRMSDVAPIAVIVGTPSHDGMTPELLKFASGKYPIHVSTRPEQIVLYKWLGRATWMLPSELEATSEEVKLVVTQIPAPTKEHWKNRQGVETDNENIAQAMGTIFAGFGAQAKTYNAPHILNGHFSMKGSMLSDTQMLPGGDIAIGKDVLSMACVDVALLGHIHKRQEYDLVDGVKAYHSGSIYRKDFGERTERKGFYVHDIRPAGGVVSTFLEAPTREMIQHDCDLIKKPWMLDDVNEDFAEKIIAVLAPYADINACIKLKLTVWMDEIRLINQSKIKRALLDAGASSITIEIDRVRRENSREEQILKAVSLVEKVKALADHRSTPVPEGVIELLELVETLSEDDLIKAAKAMLIHQDMETKEEREVA